MSSSTAMYILGPRELMKALVPTAPTSCTPPISTIHKCRNPETHARARRRSCLSLGPCLFVSTAFCTAHVRVEVQRRRQLAHGAAFATATNDRIPRVCSSGQVTLICSSSNLQGPKPSTTTLLGPSRRSEERPCPMAAQSKTHMSLK